MKKVPGIVAAVVCLVAVWLLIQKDWLFFALFLLAVLAFLLLFSRILARFALDRKAKLNLVQYFDYDTEHRSPVFQKASRKLMKNCAEWNLMSRDGLHLKAGFHKGTGHDYVILCHGYGNDAPDGMSMYAGPYLDEGWNVLMPYARAHGASEGRYIGMGWPERLDIADWCARIREQDPQAQIVLHGVSMGGATVLNAGGENPEGVIAVIADCAYTNVYDQFAAQARALFGLPAFPVLDLADLQARGWIRSGFRQADTTKQTSQIRVPVLFIHGAKDTFVPFEMLEKNWNACHSYKEKIVVQNAAHANSVSVDPDYGASVMAFLRKIRGNPVPDRSRTCL